MCFQLLDGEFLYSNFNEEAIIGVTSSFIFFQNVMKCSLIMLESKDAIILIRQVLEVIPLTSLEVL